jgi:hypothetical protein
MTLSTFPEEMLGHMIKILNYKYIRDRYLELIISRKGKLIVLQKLNNLDVNCA